MSKRVNAVEASSAQTLFEENQAQRWLNKILEVKTECNKEIAGIVYRRRSARKYLSVIKLAR